MKTPKKKPRRTAAQIEAERIAKRAVDLEAVNLHPDAAALPLQADIEVTRAGQGRGSQTVKTDSARRLDAFEALKGGMAPGAYDAARRLERDYLVRMGGSDRARPMERVDGSCQFSHTDMVIAAAQRVEQVTELLAPRERWLFVELIWPPIDRGTWRDHVNYVCGEKHTEGQAAAVRAACVNLRDAYAAIDRRVAA